MIRKAIIWALVVVGTFSTIQFCNGQDFPERFRRDEDRLGIVARLQAAEKSRNQMANQLSTQKRLIESLSERLENLRQPDTESLESRLQRRDQKRDRKQEQLMEGLFDRLKKEQSQPDQEQIAEGIFKRWRESTEDETDEGRQGLLQSLRKASAENEKLGKRLGEFKPLQGVIDRGQQLVWKIFWLAISIIVVLVVLGSILGFLYVRAKARLATLPNLPIKLP